MTSETIIIENSAFRLTLGTDCVAYSLIEKKTGKECLSPSLKLPLFTVTEDRPYNNEIKLTYMNKRTEFAANSVERNGDVLTVGFELVSFKAVVKMDIKDTYIRFTLVDFLADEKEYPQPMSYPPVAEFRLLQLPLPSSNPFGQWLNVSHCETASVCVMADSKYGIADSFTYGDTRVLTLDARRGFKLRGCGAVLTCVPRGDLLDTVEAIENDCNLPKGAASRRDPILNASIYWTENLTPENVDTHVAYAKKGGFRLMLMYYTCMFKHTGGYKLCGDYDYNDSYPNGEEDLKKVIKKINAAGIKVGFHFLHTHIGVDSRYVTPIADYRLNLTRRFTLAKPLSATDTEIFVEESTADTTTCKGCNILRFDGELITYEGYTDEPPYRFYGCKRGHFNTTVTEHNRGAVGGILDVSEFGGTSVYLDQNTDLQDEIGEKLARAYNCGFEFVYFDGSEGTNPPFEYHVSSAQHRVYSRFKKAPLFCEGAAKTHFGWHMLSGANAFDVFPTDVFKEMILLHPFKEAELMQKDLTRVNFGWWAFRDDTRPDVYEFGTSKAAAWDCPTTVVSKLHVFAKNPRTDDILEVMRRWEDLRSSGAITDEVKSMLRDTESEHTVLLNKDGKYEIVKYEQVTVGDGNTSIRAFVFTRNGLACATLWDDKGESNITLPIPVASYSKEIETQPLPFEADGKTSRFTVSFKAYVTADYTVEALTKAIENVTVN